MVHHVCSDTIGKYLLLRAGGGLDPVPALDHVGLETDGPRSAVQLEEKTTGIAKHAACFVAAPKWCCAGAAVLANWLFAEISGVLAAR